MPTDELRGELTTLADEIEPFTGDVRAVHRRVRSRRIITTALAAALFVAVVASTVAVAGHRDAGKVNVTGTGSKEVSAAEMYHVDLIVVPADPSVRQVLDASTFVRRYALMPRGIRGSAGSGLFDQSELPAFCALESEDGFAIQTSAPTRESNAHLVQVLGGAAKAYDVADTLGFDMEVFMRTGAPRAQRDSVRSALTSDADISSFRDIDQTDAYAIFKKDFADQPALVQSTKPSDLPESFRVILRPGVALQTATQRYGRLPGVDTVITNSPRLFVALSATQLGTLQAPVSACPKP